MKWIQLRRCTNTLYIIEVFHLNKWHPIGDVTLSKEMLPIVIGEKGIGKQVINLLIERAIKLDWDHLKVNKIYTYNIASRKMFEDLGFYKTDTKIDGRGRTYERFVLDLK